MSSSDGPLPDYLTDPSSLASTICYRGAAGSASWEGRVVTDAAHFRDFVRQVVGPRVADADSSFESDLRALATTGMATEHLARVLKAAPVPQAWEIGEALAECVLQRGWGRDVVWPWNMVRDRRTPRASLPGADLVGFLRDGQKVVLLFGEVKTSSDPSSPPNVMYGLGGMAWQLEQNATNLRIHLAILKWLHARCGSEPHRELFKAAVGPYLATSGRALLLVGVLVRDSPPNELDLSGRGTSLGAQINSPTRVELASWYLPAPIGSLADLTKGGVR